MKDNEMEEFSWSGLFFVTSVCSFAFTGVIKLLDGSNSSLFLVTGTATLSLWVLNAVGRGLAKISTRKSKSDNRYAS